MSKEVKPCEVPTGVGSNLATKIPDWAVATKEGCKCRDYECKMNKWGPDTCEEQLGLIVTHLVQQSDRLIPMFKALPKPARKLMAKALVLRAIAEERSKLASDAEGDA
jgi:hypothetical protein